MASEPTPTPSAEAVHKPSRSIFGKWWTYLIVLVIGLFVGGTVFIRVMQNQAINHGGGMWKRDSKTGSTVFLWRDQFPAAPSFDDPNNRPPVDNCAPTTDDEGAPGAGK